MVQLKEEDIRKFKEVCEKQGIKYDTEAEYRDAAQNLVNFYDLLFEMAMEEKQREKRLEKEPKGFEMEGKGRTCRLCQRSGYDLKFWYDKWGMKCLDCQNALNKKLIPGYVFKDHKNEKHVAASTLSWKFDIRQTTIRKLVRQGKLKAIELPGSAATIFLRRDNPDLPDVIEAEKASLAAKKRP